MYALRRLNYSMEYQLNIQRYVSQAMIAVPKHCLKKTVILSVFSVESSEFVCKSYTVLD